MKAGRDDIVQQLGRRPITVAAVIALATVLVVLTTWWLTRQDPEESVAAVRVDEVSVSPPLSAPSAAQQRQVEALEKLSGVLFRGAGGDDFVLDNSELDFGPDAWVITAGPIADFNGDGRTEPLLTELQSLVGREVTAMVRLDEDGDDADVFVLNDRVYRDSAGGAPPWLPPATTGPSALVSAIETAAAAAVGRGARVVELERVRAGNVAWEASVLAASGEEYTVLLSAEGKVLDRRRD
jgi:hypothetical protein